MATCYRHPNRETNVGCSNCGRPICPDCMTSTSVGMRCPECSRERTKVHRAPVGMPGGVATATGILIGLNVLGFLAELAGGATLFDIGGSVYREFALVPGFLGEEPYRAITSGFLHSGLLHLGLNMFALYFLGNLLEPALGAPRFVALFLLSVVGGSLGVVLIEPETVAVGASGGVFGLLAAAFLIARQRGLDDLASQIGLIVILNLVFTFSIPGISIGGHIGGLIAGGIGAWLLDQVGGSRGALDAGVAALAGLTVAAFIAAIVLAPELVLLRS